MTSRTPDARFERLTLSLLAVLCLAGCGESTASTPDCQTHQDCGPGFSCVSAPGDDPVCIVDNDADALPDVSETRDTTPTPGVVCGETRCAGAEVCCDGECVDTDQDPDHCGACGVMCDFSTLNLRVSQCIEGVCRCRDEQAGIDDICSEAELCCPTLSPSFLSTVQLCIDPDTDSINCGGCGVQCAGADDTLNIEGEHCQGGNCGCLNSRGLFEQCFGVQACCLSGCSDLLNDPDNCGACGAACDPDQDCQGGVCF